MQLPVSPYTVMLRDRELSEEPVDPVKAGTTSWI